MPHGIDQMEGSTQYHISAVLNLKGNLNIEAISHALQTMINRHEVLRTVFLEEEGKAYQFITDTKGWHLQMIDGSAYKEDGDLQYYIQQFVRKPFDLSRDYMVRASLIALSGQEHVLVVAMHHIASDGWSISIMGFFMIF